MFERGEVEGVSKDAVNKAKRALGGDSIRKDDVWYWFLPEREKKVC